MSLLTLAGVCVGFLTEAVRNNNLEIAQLLLDAGCDINLADRLHHAPIHEAIRQGQNSRVSQMTWREGVKNLL